LQGVECRCCSQRILSLPPPERTAAEVAMTGGESAETEVDITEIGLENPPGDGI